MHTVYRFFSQKYPITFYFKCAWPLIREFKISEFEVIQYNLKLKLRLRKSEQKLKDKRPLSSHSGYSLLHTIFCAKKKAKAIILLKRRIVEENFRGKEALMYARDLLRRGMYDFLTWTLRKLCLSFCVFFSPKKLSVSYKTDILRVLVWQSFKKWFDRFCFFIKRMFDFL